MHRRFRIVRGRLVCARLAAPRELPTTNGCRGIILNNFVTNYYLYTKMEIAYLADPKFIIEFINIWWKMGILYEY